MAVLLAGIAAVCYGVSDYLGGRATRRISPLLLIVIADVASLLVFLLVVYSIGEPMPAVSSLLWGSVAGFSGLVGVICLFRSLAAGVMSVAAPLSALVGVGLPVIVGLALGDRPGLPAYVGIIVAVTAVALISGLIGVPHVRTPHRIIALAVGAGVGFGLLYVFLGLASAGGDWWPLIASRATTVPILLVALTATVIAERRSGRAVPGDATRRGVLAIGRLGVVVALTISALGGTANVLYLAATRRGLLSIVAVVVAMYPAATVILAMALDHERVRRPQVVGLGLAAVALALVTVGA